MKKLLFIISALILLNSCSNGKLNKPDLKKPFSKCPPKGERTIKDILCRE